MCSSSTFTFIFNINFLKSSLADSKILQLTPIKIHGLVGVGLIEKSLTTVPIDTATWVWWIVKVGARFAVFVRRARMLPSPKNVLCQWNHWAFHMDGTPAASVTWVGARVGAPVQSMIKHTRQQRRSVQSTKTKKSEYMQSLIDMYKIQYRCEGTYTTRSRYIQSSLWRSEYAHAYQQSTQK